MSSFSIGPFEEEGVDIPRFRSRLLLLAAIKSIKNIIKWHFEPSHHKNVIDAIERFNNKWNKSKNTSTTIGFSDHLLFI